MLLNEYIKKNELTVYGMTMMIGCAKSVLYNHFAGRNRISARIAKRIEEVTKGKVTMMEAMYPEISKGKSFKDIVCKEKSVIESKKRSN